MKAAATSPDPRAVARLLADRGRQGLPPKCYDPAVLAKVAGLLGSVARPPQA
jgi:hypothetical protein